VENQKKETYRVTVTQLIGLLVMPKEYLEKCSKRPKKYELNKKFLGFNNSIKYGRYYSYEGNLFYIEGIPPKINEEEEMVEGLKICNSKNARKIEDAGIGELALYADLTGLKKIRLYLYNIDTKKLEKKEYRIKKKEVNDVLRAAFVKYLTTIQRLDEILENAEKIEEIEGEDLSLYFS